jgi:hypothetical protein
MSLEDIIASGNRSNGRSGWVYNNLITCADGFELSVIAGWGAYCDPRPDYSDNENYAGPYSAVEVMIIDGSTPDGWDDVGADVHGHVPVDQVRALIATHGGER